MSTFLQRLRVTVLGNVNDLLDKTIDLNSPSVLRQYVRDLEDAQDKLRNEAAIQAGQVRTTTREIADMEAKAVLGKATVSKLQANPANADLARAKATEVVALQKRIVDLKADLPKQQEASTKIDQAVSRLESKHTTMLANLRDLERLDVETKSKEQAARSLQAAGRLVDGGADVSVDDIQRKMRARNDVASEKFDRAMGDVQVTEDPDTTAAVDDLLKETAPKQEKASAAK